jgi:hypothetical protein
VIASTTGHDIQLRFKLRRYSGANVSSVVNVQTNEYAGFINANGKPSAAATPRRYSHDLLSPYPNESVMPIDIDNKIAVCKDTPFSTATTPATIGHTILLQALCNFGTDAS